MEIAYYHPGSDLIFIIEFDECDLETLILENHGIIIRLGEV